MIDEIVSGRISALVIAHKDRLVRFRFELIQHLCKTHDYKLVMMDNESLSPEQELIQDMLAVIYCFSARHPKGPRKLAFQSSSQRKIRNNLFA